MSEKRLIDADRLETKLLTEISWYDNRDEDVAYEAIHAAPTIDAVEVVRCKECRHSSRIASDISGRMRHCWSGRGRNNGDGFSRVNGDGYCDEGERMDADDLLPATKHDAPERAGKEREDA